MVSPTFSNSCLLNHSPSFHLEARQVKLQNQSEVVPRPALFHTPTWQSDILNDCGIPYRGNPSSILGRIRLSSSLSLQLDSETFLGPI